MKKYFSIAMAVVLVLVMFCACSKEENNESVSADLINSIDSTYDYYDESTVNAYNAVCDAVKNGETSVRINTSLMPGINTLLYTSFPFMDLIESIDINDDSSGISISYKNDTDTHLKLVSEFAQKIGEIQTACKNSTTSDAVYALNLYRYIATNAQESDNSVCSLYETVTSGSGTVDSYSKLFEYLLLQAGIEAHHVICEDEDNVSTGISLVKLGDEEFYFSPMLEYLDNKGKSLKYFGMSTIDAELYGLTAFAYTNQEYIDELEFNKFDDCRKAKSYNIDGTTMFVTENDGTVVEIYL